MTGLFLSAADITGEAAPSAAARALSGFVITTFVVLAGLHDDGVERLGVVNGLHGLEGVGYDDGFGVSLYGKGQRWEAIATVVIRNVVLRMNAQRPFSCKGFFGLLMLPESRFDVQGILLKGRDA